MLLQLPTMSIYRALEPGEEDAQQTTPFPASLLGIYSCHGSEPAWEEGDEVMFYLFLMAQCDLLYYMSLRDSADVGGVGFFWFVSVVCTGCFGTVVDINSMHELCVGIAKFFNTVQRNAFCQIFTFGNERYIVTSQCRVFFGTAHEHSAQSHVEFRLLVITFVAFLAARVLLTQRNFAAFRGTVVVCDFPHQTEYKNARPPEDIVP